MLCIHVELQLSTSLDWLMLDIFIIHLLLFFLVLDELSCVQIFSIRLVRRAWRNNVLGLESFEFLILFLFYFKPAGWIQIFFFFFQVLIHIKSRMTANLYCWLISEISIYVHYFEYLLFYRMLLKLLCCLGL